MQSGGGGQQMPFAGNPHHGLLQLFKGAHLNLTHAFARDAKFLAQFFKRPRLINKAPFGQDLLFAVGQALHRFDQQRMALNAFFRIGDNFILQRPVIDQRVLPLAFAILIQRDVERGVATAARDRVVTRAACDRDQEENP